MIKPKKKKFQLQGNPTIFIESTIHSREWVTVATATYLLNELLTSNDEEVKKMAENYDWVFVPVLNVDGYAYTHSHVGHVTIHRNPILIFSSLINLEPNVEKNTSTTHKRMYRC